MARKKTSKSTTKRLLRVSVDCDFCKAKKEPDYKDYEALASYVTDRAKIVGKRRTGVCSKHQRRLSVAIKRARHLGLLPFTPTL